MTNSRALTGFATRRLSRRLSRAMPWIGGAIALLTLAGAIRRKGFLGGTAHTVLDFMPFVGPVKNALEYQRGRDFIRDRQRLGA
jgi:hypothetical protein